MNHLPFTLTAYLLNSISVTIDKVLLTKHIPDPLIYIFYLSCVSLIALLLLPFTHIPPTQVLILASISTLLWTTGAYFMFKATQIGVVSRVIPFIGTLVPIILLGNAFFNGSVTINETWAVLILVLGLVFLTAGDLKGKIKGSELIFIFLSALFFSSSYIILRQAYLQDNFLTVFAWSRPILIPVGLMLLALPQTRNRIFTNHKPNVNFNNQAKILFVIGQIAGGSQELLLTFSVSLADPSLVNSLQGTQYIFLFIFSLILSRKYPGIFKENRKKLVLFGKLIGILLITFGLYLLSLSAQNTKNQPQLGLTYSPRYAKSLGLDPKQTYVQMLNDLKVKNIRLPVYWDEVEENPGLFNFSNADFYINEARKKNIQIVLVLGYKQPRWPECFTPDWVKQIRDQERKIRLLNLIHSEVNYFKAYPNIKLWQVENEPLLHFFGDCNSADHINSSFLKDEIAIVKKYDSRPVLITDSGELSNWIDAISSSDEFGTTLYRTVWSPYFGLVDYPYPPAYYQIKNDLIRTLTNKKSGQSIVAELQAEPWARDQDSLSDNLISSQIKDFPAQKIIDNLSFARQTKFSEIYLWGVEWWYFMKDKNHPEYVNTAKFIFSQ